MKGWRIGWNYIKDDNNINYQTIKQPSNGYPFSQFGALTHTVCCLVTCVWNQCLYIIWCTTCETGGGSAQWLGKRRWIPVVGASFMTNPLRSVIIRCVFAPSREWNHSHNCMGWSTLKKIQITHMGNRVFILHSMSIRSVTNNTGYYEPLKINKDYFLTPNFTDKLWSLLLGHKCTRTINDHLKYQYFLLWQNIQTKAT